MNGVKVAATSFVGKRSEQVFLLCLNPRGLGPHWLLFEKVFLLNHFKSLILSF